MSERVRVTIEGGVADVRLNRPEKLNALDLAMFEGIAAAGKQLAEDRRVRAVVLSGEGRGFCAGLDFASFMAMSGGDAVERRPSLLDRDPGMPANYAQLAGYIWTTLPVPVIAAIHGMAFGGGLQIAMGADIRLIAPEAQMSVMEIKWGLIPDMSGTQTLRHLVRQDVAKELTFTGRVVLGEEAVQLGLATRTSANPLQEALDMARQIAGKSPDAIRAGKKLFNAAYLTTLEEGLRLEESTQLSLIGTPNQMEAVQANMQKRPPEFADPA